NKPTLVIGASENEERYSNIAVKMLLSYQHNVFAIGNKLGSINNVPIMKGMPHFENIDTITLYINKNIQKEYYDYIFSLKPSRIIFNPGTENNELIALAEQNGVSAIVACTLVLLKTEQY
ncbi:MAG: CoA-binding protein, partial [Chitinophagaceae bacterium]